MLTTLAIRGWLARAVSHKGVTGPAALGILVALCAAALVACGQASVPTPTCGTVSIDHLGNVYGTQVEQTETCFYQGFEQCQAVSLGLTHMGGVDTATESIFSVQTTNGSGCTIAEADYNLVNTSVTATGTTTCTGLSRQGDGLLITSCSSGHDVTIPAPPPSTPSPAPSPSPTT